MKTVTRPVRAKRTKVDGFSFDSRGEAKRYLDLRNLERAGFVRYIEVHPKLALVVNGKKIGRGYLKLDYRYEERETLAGPADWVEVWEDYKAVDTRESKLRRALAEAIHGITIKVTSRR